MRSPKGEILGQWRRKMARSRLFATACRGRRRTGRARHCLGSREGGRDGCLSARGDSNAGCGGIWDGVVPE